jgi:hypothetical protein
VIADFVVSLGTCDELDGWLTVCCRRFMRGCMM